VIEDAAQSLGASWNGRPIGSAFGQGRLRFLQLPRQQEPDHGEGGALVLPTDIDPALCERLRLQGVRRFPDGGMDVDVLGGKFNMTDIAAAIGLGQCPT
jgi:dTDP-4-amino-4,6-dideoxygalactose transaminase